MIFILQFLNENEISFSDGKIMNIIDNIIFHGASTEEGSSGSPIIKRDINPVFLGSKATPNIQIFKY